MLLDCLVLPTGSKWRDFLRRVWNTLPSSVATRSVRAGASCDRSVLLISIFSDILKRRMKLSWWIVKRLRERMGKKSKWWKVERVRVSSGKLLQKHGLMNINTTKWSLYTSIHFSGTYERTTRSCILLYTLVKLISSLQQYRTFPDIGCRSQVCWSSSTAVFDWPLEVVVRGAGLLSNVL